MLILGIQMGENIYKFIAADVVICNERKLTFLALDIKASVEKAIKIHF